METPYGDNHGSPLICFFKSCNGFSAHHKQDPLWWNRHTPPFAIYLFRKTLFNYWFECDQDTITLQIITIAFKTLGGILKQFFTDVSKVWSLVNYGDDGGLAFPWCTSYCTSWLSLVEIQSPFLVLGNSLHWGNARVIISLQVGNSWDCSGFIWEIPRSNLLLLIPYSPHFIHKKWCIAWRS
jgi:hypothetical protein